VSRLPVVPGHRDQRRDDHLRPATAYSENWEYAPFFIGSSLAKWAVAFIFIPAFYRYEVTTIYQFLLHRFGQKSQVTASIFFFITRLAGSGARLTMTALAVGYLMGWSLVPTIVIFSVESILYIATGGVKAVVWTNVFQAAMIAMALVNLVLLLLIETKRLALGWSWLVIVGTAGTIVLALLFSLPAGSRSAERLRTASR
jgi:Na+/proline symporter